MTFTSATFVLFLIAVFGLYWALESRRAQNRLLIAASYFFYGWWDARFCLLMAGSSLVDYYVGRFLERVSLQRHRRWLLGLSIAVNLGLLGCFKYYDFFVDTLATSLSALGLRVHLSTLRLTLPVGISFYTFQTLGYTIDIYRKRLRASRSLVDYLAFVSFFPQLVAGPIERAPHLLPQFEQPRRFAYEDAVTGARLMLWGFFKKMVLADNIASIVDPAYSAPQDHPGPVLLLATICFAFQIYWDFSGYSDIAIGTARLFGFRLMRNFAYPYFSRSVGEFWRRWHVSLSSWFRDYVYIPLGGNRVSRLRQASNLLITFGTSGLWHGASWTFVIWGLINGAAVIPTALGSSNRHSRSTDVPGSQRTFPTLAEATGMLRCFALVTLAWVFFRAESVSDAALVLKRITTGMFEIDGWQDALWTTSIGQHPLALSMGAAAIVSEWLGRRHACPWRFERLPRLVRWPLYLALTWVVMVTGTFVSGQFIYFQF